MSFPNYIYRKYGDEKVAQSAKIGSLPLGARMILPTGEVFAHAQMSATAAVAGNLYQLNSLAVVAGTADADMINNMGMAASAAIGATTLSVTLAGTAAASKDLFEDGILFVADSAGQGLSYRIKSNGSAAAGSACSFTLYPGDGLKVAVVASSTKVGIRQSAFKNITITTADTATVGPVAGVMPVAASASFYCWVQRSGLVAGLNDNTTLIVGEPVGVSAQLAGAFGVLVPGATASVKRSTQIGWCANVAAASAKYGLVHLNLE